eukprot:JP447672.1.p2 GENE.JP447672.1~~JP447672.1.p2  ORF type:complete len:119 (+),score=18.20 JP447672.1:32-388(+)
MSNPCKKWADCRCTMDEGDTCDCSNCGCGSVTFEQVEAIKATACPWLDCPCGDTCGCGASCQCGGKTPKTTSHHWAKWVKKNKPEADKGQCPWSDCSCTAKHGTCACGAGCGCGTVKK